MKEADRKEIIKIIKEEVCNVRRGLQGRIETMIEEFRRLRKEQAKTNKLAIKSTAEIAKLVEKNNNTNESVEMIAVSILHAIRQREFLQEWIPDKKEIEKKAWPKDFE